MDAVKIVLEYFESFIRRTLLPSSSFIMFYMLYDFYLNDKSLLNFLDKEHTSVITVMLIMLLLGLSYLLSILHQLVYDNLLKNNYNAYLGRKKENLQLNTLRSEIIKKLNISDTYNDYYLYQILGQKKEGSEVNIDTKRYVDETKAIGIFFISLIIVLIFTIVKISSNSTFMDCVTSCIIAILVISIVYFIGRDLIISKYRSRAIRLYINYLECSNPSPSAT